MHLDISTALIVFPWAFFGGLEIGRWLARRVSAGPRIDSARTPWMGGGGFVTDPNMMRHFEIKMDGGHVATEGPESAPEGTDVAGEEQD